MFSEFNEMNKAITREDINKITRFNPINVWYYQKALKQKIVSQVKLNIPTYSSNDLPNDLSAIKAVKPGSRNL